jgi:hypothetical protein
MVEMSDSPQEQPVKWVPVEETPGRIAAEMGASLLRAEGIPVEVWQEGVGNALGLSVGPLGTAYVMVPEEFLEEAQALLGVNEEVEEESPYDDYVECPQCGTALELDETELEQGWFTCPECHEVVNIVYEDK